MNIYSAISSTKKNIQFHANKFYRAASENLPSKKAIVTFVALHALTAAGYYYASMKTPAQNLAKESSSISNLTDFVNGTAVYFSLNNQQPLFAPIMQKILPNPVNETVGGLSEQPFISLPEVISDGSIFECIENGKPLEQTDGLIQNGTLNLDLITSKNLEGYTEDQVVKAYCYLGLLVVVLKVAENVLKTN